MNPYDAHLAGDCGDRCVVCEHEATTTCGTCYDLHGTVTRLDAVGDCPASERHTCQRCGEIHDTITQGALCDGCLDEMEGSMLELLRCTCTDDVRCDPCHARRLRERAEWGAWAVAEHGSVVAAEAADDRARLDEWLDLGGPWADAARAELEEANR